MTNVDMEFVDRLLKSINLHDSARAKSLRLMRDKAPKAEISKAEEERVEALVTRNRLLLLLKYAVKQ